MNWFARGPIGLASLLLALTVPLGAQDRGVSLTLRTGIAGPDDAYQSNCGYQSLAFSADLQTRGQYFPQLAIDRHSGSGGGDVLCLPAAPGTGTVVGGLRLEGSTRYSLGIGGRVGTDHVYLEGVLRSGLISGRHGYTPSLRSNEESRRVWLPHIGTQVSLELFRWIVLSGNVHWTRLTKDFTAAGTGRVTTTTDWAPMTTVQIGVRLPVWRGRATN